jgi:hypothetical protein
MARKPLSTKIENDLQKELKKLAIDLERPLNALLEEAMRDLLDKYKKTPRSRAFSSPYRTPFARKSPEYRRKFLKEIFDMIRDGSLIPESQKSKQNQE